jgi:hypothetical protein
VASNKFSKALRHLKSTELDEKIQSLNESPTNSIGGVYALNQPGFRLSRELDPPKVFYPDVDGNWPAGIPGTPGEPNYVRPAGYWDEGPGTTAANPYDTLYTADWSYSVQEDNPRNTETLIDPDTGYVRSELPPNSRSFILGPLVDLYFHNHSNDNRTYVGYVQKDTREFVLLGYVNGRWGNDDDGNLIYQDGFTSGRIWNGEQSGFTASNSNFTFEMLQWFHNKLKAGKYVKNASFFNSGGVPIISGGGGTGQPSGTTQGNAVGAGGPADAGNNGNANTGAGTGGNPTIGTPQSPSNHGGPTAAGAPFPNANPNSNPNTPPPLPPNNPPPPEEPEDNDTPGEIESLYQAMLYSYKREYEKANSQAAAITGGFLLAGWTIAQLKAALGTAIVAGGTIAIIKARMNAVYGNALNSLSISLDPYGTDQAGPDTTGDNPRAKDLTPEQQAEVEAAGNELRDAQRALNDLPADATDAQRDMAQERLDRARKNRQRIRRKHREENKHRKESSTLNGEVLTESRKRILREIKQPYKMKETPKQKYKMNFKGKFTAQNTPDVTASKKSDEVVTAKNAAGQTWRTQDKYWSGYESTERMNVIYDHVGHGQIYWDTIVNENRHKKNMRDREIQEHLNLIEHKKAMKEIIEQQTLDAPKDPLFKKVAKRLKTEIDYPDKPSKNGYPDTPPPEMVNGFHPKYGKTYKYDKLDPHSAESMPPTGNPEIDANVQKAKRLKKILGKKG